MSCFFVFICFVCLLGWARARGIALAVELISARTSWGKNQKGAQTLLFVLLFLVVILYNLRKSNLSKKKSLNKIKLLFNRFFNEFLKRRTFSVPSSNELLFCFYMLCLLIGMGTSQRHRASC